MCHRIRSLPQRNTHVQTCSHFDLFEYRATGTADDALLLLNCSPGSRGSLATTRGPCSATTTLMFARNMPGKSPGDVGEPRRLAAHLHGRKLKIYIFVSIVPKRDSE